MTWFQRWWQNRTADRFTYSPNPNGRADIGEVCWAWVPFEDDPGQGKDLGRTWLDIGGGAWDRRLTAARPHWR